MKSKNITLRVDIELYDKYREYCKKEGWLISRQFEKMMEAQLKDNE
jgi:phage/plasmid-associated DNA primase